MSEIKRKMVHKAIEITVNLGNYQFLKAVAKGEWEVSGDCDVTKEQHHQAELEIADEAKKSFMTTLSEMGKGTDEAVAFFEACRDKKTRKDKPNEQNRPSTTA